MSGEKLALAARKVIRAATAPIDLPGRTHDFERVVILPANTLRWLSEAMTPEEREPYPFVSVNPGMCWGQPCVGSTRLPVEMIAEYVWAGSDMAALSSDWDYLRRGDVLVACWFQAQYGGRRWRKRWGAWARTAGMALWACTTVDYEAVPWPPTEAGKPATASTEAVQVQNGQGRCPAADAPIGGVE